MSEKIRIQKLLSEAGLCSRREAEKLIKNQKVKVNGALASLGDKASFDDTIIVNNQLLATKQEKKYFILNKPEKTICTLKDHLKRKLARDLINEPGYYFSIGRLDYNTKGVIIFTNDGDLANKLAHPRYQIERIYRARLNEKLELNNLKFLNSNKVLVDNKISLQQVKWIDKKSYEIKLCQGSYHHVKKIFESVNRQVIDLKRISFAGLTCEKMPLGTYRELKPFELKKLKLLAASKHI